MEYFNNRLISIDILRRITDHDAHRASTPRIALSVTAF
jgi:hypothetical protein